MKGIFLGKQGAHSIQRRDDAAFVVLAAPAVDPAVLHRALKRRQGPPIARRHDIQMHKDADLLFALAHLDIAGVPVHIPHPGKAQAFGQIQRIQKTVVHGTAKGLARQRGRLQAGHGDQLAKLGNHFFLVGQYNVVELHMKSPPFRYPYDTVAGAASSMDRPPKKWRNGPNHGKIKKIRRAVRPHRRKANDDDNAKTSP